LRDPPKDRMSAPMTVTIATTADTASQRLNAGAHSHS
jgi:hypothetical protein